MSCFQHLTNRFEYLSVSEGLEDCDKSVNELVSFFYPFCSSITKDVMYTNVLISGPSSVIVNEIVMSEILSFILGDSRERSIAGHSQWQHFCNCKRRMIQEAAATENMYFRF